MISRPPPLVVWGFNDGRAGHLSQVRGLMRALARITNCEPHELAVPPAGRAWPGLLRPGRGPAPGLPPPDLVIGAGHATHVPMLWTRRAQGGRLVVLMRPSLPLSWFDACLIPEHDNPPPMPHVLATRGPLNTVAPAAERRRGQGLILIGGPSRHYDWDNDALLKQLGAVLSGTAQAWQISDSPRTPATTRKALGHLAGLGARYQPWDRCPPGWLAQQLGQVQTCWVTEDSMSMVHESLSGGAATGLLEVPARGRSRIQTATRALVEAGLARRFSNWQGGPLSPPEPPLDEAGRSAAWLLQRFEAR